jgi:hypothetical protein
MITWASAVAVAQVQGAPRQPAAFIQQLSSSMVSPSIHLLVLEDIGAQQTQGAKSSGALAQYCCSSAGAGAPLDNHQKLIQQPSSSQAFT